MTTNINVTDARIQGVMDQLTAAVVASIEAGIADPKGWKAPWHTMLAGAVNATTKRAYTGGNVMMLAFSGKPGPFATFNQWKGVGAMVRKGEHGVPILVPVPVKFTKADKDGGDEKTVAFTRYKVAYVFSADQVDGWNAPDANVNGAARIADADAWLAEWSKVVPVSYSPNRAFYVPALDTISVPAFDDYDNAENFYATVFHEAAHSTGHADRLDRTMGGGFGSTSYAKEELVAELTAAFMGHHFGIVTDVVDHGHADYLANWLQVLKADTSLLWNAAGDAQKAAALLLSVVPEA